jgi:HrpA-like RNA helicase
VTAERDKAASASTSKTQPAANEMGEIDFLRRKRARRDAGSGGTANEGRRRKGGNELPLLNGAVFKSITRKEMDPVKFLETTEAAADPGPNPMFLKSPKNSAVEAARMMPPPKTRPEPKELRVHDAQLKQQAFALRKSREQLPIYPYANWLRKCLRDRNVLVMLGETGSGKSTQIGQFLVDEPWRGNKCIAITQPRRVAAVNLARRVAVEMGVRLGEEVGYNVRFDNKSSEKTKIKFLTDGMLLQEMLADPKLRKYSCVVVDEAHERTVGTDLVMGFLRGLVYGERRGNLKVVVMSATLEVEAMARFFEENRGVDVPLPGQDLAETPTEVSTQETGVPAEKEAKGDSQEPDKKDKKKKKKKKNKKGGIDTMELIRSPSPIPERIKTPELVENEGVTVTNQDKLINPYFGSVALFHVPGRQYPVQAFHSEEPQEDYIYAALKTVFVIHYHEPLPGDILVFLTGQEEIETLKKSILEYAANMAPDKPKVRFQSLCLMFANSVCRCTSSRSTRPFLLSSRTKFFCRLLRSS